jgi:hypothetical protein
VGTGIRIADESGKTIQEMVWPPDYGDLRSQFRAIATRDWWLGGSNSGLLAPRAVFEEAGMFDERLRGAEDWDLWLRIAARFPIHNLQEILTYICAHGTGYARDVKRVEAAQFAVFEKAAAQWPQLMDARLRRRVRALIHADAGMEYAGGRDFRAALKSYVASLAQWPFVPRRWYTTGRVLLKAVRG